MRRSLRGPSLRWLWAPVIIALVAMPALLLRPRRVHGVRPPVPLAIDPRFQYNLAMSEWLPLDRPVPEARNDACLAAAALPAAAPLPQTSIIIVEYNEADVTLARTVTSVLNRSPRGLLADIVIVDDHSDWEVGPRVRSLTPLMKLVRNDWREGLIRSRLVGFDASGAPTVTFLDAHCEVAPGWLPPLLGRVAADPTIVVAPVIDVIDRVDFRCVRN